MNEAIDTRTLVIRRSVLVKNDDQARLNREHFRSLSLLTINLLSSPGAGKTALLERTLTELGPVIPSAVIVGDLATDNDAKRIARSGAQVKQITTGNMCHLEARMVAGATSELSLSDCRILFIENVGNLVCPASYDLGEDVRVILISVTEGEDKPLKYPKIFKSADIVLITKSDLAQATGFDREMALANIRNVAPQACILELSSRSGEGMHAWYSLIEEYLPHAGK